MPVFTVPKVGGADVKIGVAGAWRIVMVYSGKHCPIVENV